MLKQCAQRVLKVSLDLFDNILIYIIKLLEGHIGHIGHIFLGSAPAVFYIGFKKYVSLRPTRPFPMISMGYPGHVEIQRALLGTPRPYHCGMQCNLIGA